MKQDLMFKNIVEKVYRYENKFENGYEHLILHDKNEKVLLNIKKPFKSNINQFIKSSNYW